MATILRFVTSSRSKKKEPRSACLNEAKASHPHRTWTAVSSSVPQLPQGPKKEPRYVCQKNQKPLVRDPLPVPPTGSLWRKKLRLQNHWFIHSFISVGVPKKEPSHKMWGKHTVTIHRSACGRKAYIQWGAAWFPKAMVYDTAISTPVSCSHQCDTFQHGLGTPEPH